MRTIHEDLSMMENRETDRKDQFFCLGEVQPKMLSFHLQVSVGTGGGRSEFHLGGKTLKKFWGEIEEASGVST